MQKLLSNIIHFKVSSYKILKEKLVLFVLLLSEIKAVEKLLML